MFTQNDLFNSFVPGAVVLLSLVQITGQEWLDLGSQRQDEYDFYYRLALSANYGSYKKEIAKIL